VAAFRSSVRLLRGGFALKSHPGDALDWTGREARRVGTARSVASESALPSFSRTVRGFGFGFAAGGAFAA
jgi:hypothetical protein